MTLWQVWWIALAIKIALLPVLPITPDETYYFVWARHLALSYFDHPPFVAWLMTLAIPFWKSPFGIRLPGVLFSHLGVLPWIYLLKKQNFSPLSQLIWMLAILVGPLTGLGGFIITPDVPLMFFWGAALAAFNWVLESANVARWILLGALLGFGMLSKYTMVLFFPAALIYLFWSGQLKLLKTPGPWLSLITCALFFSPVIIWNFENHFASFAFQSKHGLSGQDFSWSFPFEYISAQLGLLNPFFVACAIAVSARSKQEDKFLKTFAFFPLFFFLLTSFRSRVEANWPVCAYPCVMALFARIIDDPILFKKWKVFFKIGFSASALFLVLVLSHAIHSWLPIPPDRDHTMIMREWLGDVEALKDVHPLFARSYQIAAFQSYFRNSKQEVFKVKGLDRNDFYDFISESELKGPAHVILNLHDKLPAQWESKFALQNPVKLPSGLYVFELVPKDQKATP